MNTYLLSIFSVVSRQGGSSARVTFTPVDHQVRGDFGAVFMNRAETHDVLTALGVTAVEQVLDDLETGTVFQRAISTEQATAIHAQGWQSEDRGVNRRAS